MGWSRLHLRMAAAQPPPRDRSSHSVVVGTAAAWRAPIALQSANRRPCPRDRASHSVVAGTARAWRSPIALQSANGRPCPRDRASHAVVAGTARAWPRPLHFRARTGGHVRATEPRTPSLPEPHARGRAHCTSERERPAMSARQNLALRRCRNRRGVARPSATARSSRPNLALHHGRHRKPVAREPPTSRLRQPPTEAGYPFASADSASALRRRALRCRSRRCDDATIIEFTQRAPEARGPPRSRLRQTPRLKPVTVCERRQRFGVEHFDAVGRRDDAPIIEFTQRAPWPPRRNWSCARGCSRPVISVRRRGRRRRDCDRPPTEAGYPFASADSASASSTSMPFATMRRSWSSRSARDRVSGRTPTSAATCAFARRCPPLRGPSRRSHS